MTSISELSCKYITNINFEKTTGGVINLIL